MRQGWKALLSGLAMAVLAIASFASPAAAAFPERPITLIVPWAAGGGTDAVSRMVAVLLEKEFGQPVNVVNRTGGSGVVGHQAIATAKPSARPSVVILFIRFFPFNKNYELDPALYLAGAILRQRGFLRQRKAPAGSLIQRYWVSICETRAARKPKNPKTISSAVSTR